jgi:GntP family gluconate:H+ symporter
MPLIILLLAVIAIIWSTSKLKIHPFLSLFAVAVLYGVSIGLGTDEIISSIKDGFGGTIGNIGIVIILGVIMGSFLEHTGAALKITQVVLKIIGQSRVPWAMAFMGYVISIPVFADSGFVILNALNKSLTRKAGLSIVTTAVALSMGLASTHIMVPPTPGPIAAAGILNANLGWVILLGMIVAFFSLIPVVIFVQKVGKNMFVEAPKSNNSDKIENMQTLPPFWKSVLPIILPLGLIVLGSINSEIKFTKSLWLSSVFNFLGNPIIALSIGVIVALFLPKPLEKKMLSTEGWVGQSIIGSADIIMITGAGGIFGKMIQNGGFAEFITQNIEGLSIGIFLPFIISAIIKTAQGSSTIAIITTASVIAPLLPVLGLESEIQKALVVVVIGAGSIVVSHINDSFFWVVTQMSGLTVQQGYKSHTLASGVLGFCAFLLCYFINFFL